VLIEYFVFIYSGDEETPEASPEEVHEVLSKIKTLAVNAKKSFKKRKVYRFYCEELIDRWIPDLKRVREQGEATTCSP
jgi:hypothetical protein